MERPLGALEHSQWLYDQIHPLHFAITAKIRGQFSLDRLPTALAQRQAFLNTLPPAQVAVARMRQKHSYDLLPILWQRVCRS